MTTCGNLIASLRVNASLSWPPTPQRQPWRCRGGRWCKKHSTHLAKQLVYQGARPLPCSATIQLGLRGKTYATHLPPPPSPPEGKGEARKLTELAFSPEVNRIEAVIRADERERCAKVAEEFRDNNPYPTYMDAIAAAIRKGE